MENKTKRIYPSQQLVCSLPPTALKVFIYLCGWQSQEFIKLFVKQMVKALKLTEEEVEIAVQTLSDTKLIDISRQGDVHMCQLNGEQIQKYFKIPFDKIMESNGIQLSTNVTWNKDVEKKNDDIEGMSESDLKRLLLRIEASLNEKQQMKKCVITNDVENKEIDDLPF